MIKKTKLTLRNHLYVFKNYLYVYKYNPALNIKP